MNTKSSKGPFVDPGVCRCCGFKKKCRIMDIEYDHFGNPETYSDMILNCFGLLVTNPETELSEKLICATCVLRLREASAFRQQILNCEETLLERVPRVPNVEVEVESVKNEVLMVELDGSSDAEDTAADGDDDDDPEYEPEPEPQPKRVTPKRTKKTESTKVKKLKELVTTKETTKRSTNQYTSNKESAELKKMLLARLHKLKAMADPEPHPALLSHARPRRHKDRLIFENTVKIVESSFVCPFNNIIGTFHCFYCKLAFIKPEELREHTLATHDPKEFPQLWPKNKAIKIDISRIDCKHCEVKIDSIDDLKRHLTEAHAITFHDITNEFLKFKICRESLECLECGASYLFIDKLIEHMAQHFGTHVCDYCGVGFVQLSSLIAHVRGHKQAAKDFPCPVCGKNLRTARSRWQHMMVVHEKKPVIKCIKCSETFLSYERRDLHLRDDHGDARTYPCQECGKIFDIRRRYMSHVKSVHLKSYKLQCQLCERRFCKPRDLKNHLQTHGGVVDVNLRIVE